MNNDCPPTQNQELADGKQGINFASPDNMNKMDFYGINTYCFLFT